MWEKERTKPLKEGSEARRKGDGGSKRRDEGQVWADMEEMRVHGGGEEEGEGHWSGRRGADRRGEEGGGGENPSPVKASRHEGLKVDGAGERWKEGQAQTERRREVGRRRGQMGGKARMVEWVWHHGGRDTEEQAGRSSKQ